MSEEENDLLYAVMGCPHGISKNEIILRHDTRNDGLNALDQLTRRLSPFREELTTLRAQLAEAEKERDQFIAKSKDYHKKACEIADQRDFQKARADGLAKELEEMTTKWNEFGCRIDQLKEQLAAKTAEAERLRHILDNTFLEKAEIKEDRDALRDLQQRECWSGPEALHQTEFVRIYRVTWNNKKAQLEALGELVAIGDRIKSAVRSGAHPDEIYALFAKWKNAKEVFTRIKAEESAAPPPPQESAGKTQSPTNQTREEDFEIEQSDAVPRPTEPPA